MTRFMLIASLLLVTSTGCVIRTSGHAHVEPMVTTVETAPPPPRRVERPAPRGGYVWVEGHWQRRGDRWVWIDGRWQRQRADYVWVDGHWEDRGGTWVWIEGRWEAVARQERRVVPDRGTVVTPGTPPPR